MLPGWLQARTTPDWLRTRALLMLARVVVHRGAASPATDAHLTRMCSLTTALIRSEDLSALEDVINDHQRGSSLYDQQPGA